MFQGLFKIVQRKAQRHVAVVITWCVTRSFCIIHDDIIKWKHFPRHWPFVRVIHRWRGALMFSLICPWTNGWANTRDAGDLRRHRPHYDLTVMFMRSAKSCPGVFHSQINYVWNLANIMVSNVPADSLDPLGAIKKEYRLCLWNMTVQSI